MVLGFRVEGFRVWGLGFGLITYSPTNNWVTPISPLTGIVSKVISPSTSSY